MVIDCHVHVSACTPGHGSMSRRLLSGMAFRFMRWRFGLEGEDESTERALEAMLARTLAEAERIDKAVILAFDAVHDADGRADWPNTHLYVTNDYVIELCRRHRKMLFGASIDPRRRDAIAELERCVKAGAVLLKWLPVTQGMNPAEERFAEFYEAMAHWKLPLLCHTGGETSLPQLRPDLADPMLLLPALRRGVTVIAAHCGTRSMPLETDYVGAFVRLAKEHERFYGDTSALNLPFRWYAYGRVLDDPAVRAKLVHGSDWPILPLPPPRRLGWGSTWELLEEPNWMVRDERIKRQLGLDEDYWHRAGRILRLEL